MCLKCGESLPQGIRVGFRDLCPACGAELHVCVMCRFYKPGAHYDCAETVDSPVADKHRANFCEWFSLDRTVGKKNNSAAGDKSQADSAKSAFDALFKL